MNKFFKRLALLLAVLMIVSMMPVQLFADNSVTGEEQSNGAGEASGNSNAVAKIGTNEYASLADAINASQSGDTITLLTDVDMGIKKIGFYNSGVENLTFDLNGHKITSAVNDNGTVVASRAGLVIKNGTIENTYTDSKAKDSTSAIYVTNGGTTTLENVTLLSNYSGLYVCQLKNAVTVVVNVGEGTTINGGKYGIKLDAPTGTKTKIPEITLNVNGGTLTGAKAGVHVSGPGSSQYGTVNVNIKAGKVSGVTTVSNNESQSVNLGITGGKIKGELKVVGGESTVAISGGTFDYEVPADYCTDGFIPKQNEDGTYGVKAKYAATVNGTNYETLAEAIAAANDGDTIIVSAGEYTTYGNVSPKKSLTFVGAGAGNTIWTIGDLSKDVGKEQNGDYSFDGCDTIIFKDMTLKVDNANYRGFIRINNTVVENCTLEGRTAYWGYNTATFTDCTFNAPEGDYALWDYSTKTMTFDGCEFNISGKGVNVYVEAGNAGSEACKVEAKDCTINSTKANKAFLNIKNSTQAYEVTLSGDNQVNGLDANSTTGSNLYQVETTEVTETSGKTVKVQEKATDGTLTTVYEVKAASTAVATVNGVGYTSLADAIAAAKDGETVTLTADINTPETSYYIQKSLTIDLGGKTLTGSGYDGVFNIEGENAAVLIKNGKIVAVEQTGTAGKYTMAVLACAAGCEVTLEDLDVSQQITHTDDKQMDMIYASAGTIIINSGSFTSGTPKWTLNIKDSAYKAGTANIIVNGGTFTGYDPRNAENEGKGTSLVADGVGIDKNANGTFTAKSGMAAQIVDADGNSVAAYVGHYDAIAAAKDGETVILLSDRKNFVTNTVNANITIDLNGKTLSVGNNNPFFRTNGEVTIQNGTIDSTYACVIVNAYNKLTLKNVKITGVTGDNGKNLVNVCSNAEVTIDKDTVLTASGSGVAVFIGQDADAQYTLNVYGKVIQNSKTYAICGNGSYKGTSTINIYDGAEVKSPTCVAIYQPQAGVTNIYGGLVEGKCAIGIKSGALNISGGTVRGTLNDHVLSDDNSSGNGISYDGSAIIVDSRATGYAGNVKINVTGGTVESYYSTAIREIGEQGKTDMTQLTKLNVIGGSVIGASKNPVNVTSDMLVRDISVINISVSGGTFKHDIPDSYCADGFIPTQNEDGTYGVKEGKYVAQIGNVKYETLAEAVAAVAANGEEVTIKLLSDITAGGIDVVAGQNIVFDFDGHTYTLDGSMVGSTGTKTNGFRFLKGSTVVLKNGTLANGNGSPAKAMINSYATLKLVDFSVDARTTAVAETGSAYGYAALYISNGVTTVTGNGNYTTSDDNFVILIANVGDYTDGASLVFDENYTGTVSGRVSTGNKQNATVEIKNGKFDFKSIDVDGTDTTVTISGGKFKNIEIAGKYLDNKAFDTVADADGYYTVTGHPITSTGLTLGEDISIRIGVDAKYKDGKIKVTYETYDPNTKGMVTKEIILDKYELAGTKKYQFRISNITPQMADVVFTLQYLDSEDNKIGSAKQISIIKYCGEVAKTSAFEAYKAKIGQLLNYCATAMDLRAVTHKDDVYNGLSWAQRATALRAKISEFGYTVADIDFKTVGKYINRTSETIITGFGIEFAESVKLYYFIALDDYKDSYTYVADGLMTPVPVYEGGKLIGYRVYLTVAMDGYHTMRTLYVYDTNGKEVQRIGMAPDYALKYLYNSDEQTNEFKQLCKAAYQYFIAFAE